MGKLTDVAIRNWIKAGELFEGRSDGEGLSLRYRERDGAPRWLFRYQLVRWEGTRPAAGKLP